MRRLRPLVLLAFGLAGLWAGASLQRRRDPRCRRSRSRPCRSPVPTVTLPPVSPPAPPAPPAPPQPPPPPPPAPVSRRRLLLRPAHQPHRRRLFRLQPARTNGAAAATSPGCEPDTTGQAAGSEPGTDGSAGHGERAPNRDFGAEAQQTGVAGSRTRNRTCPSPTGCSIGNAAPDGQETAVPGTRPRFAGNPAALTGRASGGRGTSPGCGEAPRSSPARTGSWRAGNPCGLDCRLPAGLRPRFQDSPFGGSPERKPETEAVRHLFAAVAPARALDADLSDSEAPRSETLVESYRRLADVFHDVLAEQSLDSLLDRIADTLAELVPHDTLTIYEADEAQRQLRPVLARDEWAEKIMAPSRSSAKGSPAGRSSTASPCSRTRRTSTRARRVVPERRPASRGADQRAADRPRVGPQGRAQHLPARRGRVVRRRRVRARSDSATPPRSRSTTRRSARGSSTRRRPTR